MSKPIKPDVVIPSEFAAEGQKSNFSEEKIRSGFNSVARDTLEGDCLNKFIDDTYKGLNYSMDGVDDLYDVTDTNANAIASHVANTSNPHSVTKAQVGLGNVNNTSDANKPISTATQTALDNKANIALDNLSTAGSNRLHALKGYLYDGEVLTDSEGLADVITYAHSTFDSTKFTVTGTPTIADGIASGFSSSNYITNANNITIGANDDICILSPAVEFNSASSAAESIFSMYATDSNSNALQFRITNDNKLLLFWKDNSGTDIIRYTTSSTVSTGIKYQMLAIRKADVYNLYYRELGGEWINAGTSSSATFSGTYVIKYGVALSTNTNPLTVGSVDLKYCSIAVDGVPVFSGNKTSIDTIKPDNYTDVGTPTISADGVFTNTTSDSNNYVKLSNFTATSNLKAEFKFDVVGGTFNQFILNDGLSASALFIGTYGISWNTYGLSNWRGQNFIKAGHSYKFYIQYNTDLSVEIGIKRDDENAYTTATSTYTTLPTEFSLGNKASSNGSVKFDLNEIKFYSDGNLVYQPCLKIPYTQSASKYGSKIVDAVYRDRVNDAWEQSFPQRYYTLDEVNGDFTLPQGEIYGMMLNQSVPHVVESYQNGTSWYRVYSDGWCEQGGEAYVTGPDGGADITLLKSFASTNYAIFITNANYTVNSPAGLSPGSKTTAGFSLDYPDPNAYSNVFWETKGFIS